jgi:hypothetical protein
MTPLITFSTAWIAAMSPPCASALGGDNSIVPAIAPISTTAITLRELSTAITSQAKTVAKIA